MAYIKIFPIKVTDKKALDYITNPDKTDEKLLVSSFGCSPETADLEFAMTRESAKKNGMDKGNNLAFHLIQSFKPGEVDAETAHRLGQQFADEVLKGKYEYVISTHVDKNHIHNHIIFNAASFVDHHKYVSNKRSYHNIAVITLLIVSNTISNPHASNNSVSPSIRFNISPALISVKAFPDNVETFFNKRVLNLTKVLFLILTNISSFFIIISELNKLIKKYRPPKNNIYFICCPLIDSSIIYCSNLGRNITKNVESSIIHTESQQLNLSFV